MRVGHWAWKVEFSQSRLENVLSESFWWPICVPWRERGSAPGISWNQKEKLQLVNNDVGSVDAAVALALSKPGHISS